MSKSDLSRWNLSRWNGLWTRLFWVLLISVLVGWLLADFQVSRWVWGGTVAVALHLAWTGRDALFLAMVWLVSLLWVGVIRFSWPESLHPVEWSSWVLFLWVLNLAVSGLMGMGFALGLASCQEMMEQKGCDRKFTCLILTSLTSLSLGLGGLMQAAIKANMVKVIGVLGS